MKTAVKMPVCLAMSCALAIAGVDLCFGKDAPQPGASPDEILSDWLMQDVGKDGINKCFTSKADATMEAAAVGKVVAHLGEAGKPLAAEAAKLAAAKVPGNDPKWKELYTRACGVRRSKRLAALRKYCGKIVFTRHYEMGGSHYAELVGIPGQAPGFDGATALAAYRRFHLAVTNGLVASAHDASEGGLAVAFAETAFAGGYGLKVNVRSLEVADDISDIERLFSESNSRLVLTVSPDDTVAFERVMADSPCARIGNVTDTSRLVCVGVDDRVVIDEPIEELKAVWQAPLKDIG